MNHSNGDDFRKDLGDLTGEIKVLTSAIGNLTTEFREFKAGIGPRVEDHDRGLATLNAHRVNDTVYLSSIDRRVAKHIDSHSRWIGIMIGILTLLGVILTWVKKV
jgi:hypothetical protein